MANHLVLVGTLETDPVVDWNLWQGHAYLTFTHEGADPSYGDPEPSESQLRIHLNSPTLLIQFQPLRKGDVVQVEGSVYAHQDQDPANFGIAVKTCKLLFRPLKSVRN